MKHRLAFFAVIIPIVLFTTEYIIFRVFQASGVLIQPIEAGTYMLLSIVLPLLFVLVTISNTSSYLKIKSFLYTASTTWFGFVLYMFMAVVISAIFFGINFFFNLSLPIHYIDLFLFFLAVTLVLYGLFTADSPKIVNWEIRSESLAPHWGDKKVMLISDTHIGLVYKHRFMKKVVEMINKEKPDIIFHAGDLIDGPTFDYTRGFAPLKNIEAVLGTFYVEGNHEKYSREYQKFHHEFEKIGTLTNISDKKMIVNNTQIIGLSYTTKESHDDTKERLEALGFDENMPSIVIMHDPKNTRALTGKGVSLVLSGHTHGGQCFPFTLIPRKIYGPYNHGVAYTDGIPSATSYGVGTAVTPLRVGTVSEIVILNIKS